jgi:IS5 family transposase
MDRNYLKGEDGDKINAILAGCGFNIRKLIRAILLWLFKERFRGTFIDLITLIERFNRLNQPV